MGYRYYICDVFSETRFGGNPLAVLPEAAGLSDHQMQQIAREFNFSETTFVLLPEAGHTRRVRIFTPSTEVPFAGHPNVGTAFALATAGALGDVAAGATVVFEEEAGLVPVTLTPRPNGRLYCELAAPQSLSLGRTVAPELLAKAVGLDPRDIVCTSHPPQVASVGLPFLVAQLDGRDALGRARVNLDGFEELAASGVTPDVHLYVQSNDEFQSDDEFDIRARMFAPLDGVHEDPATGSANCALAGLLCQLDARTDGDFRWHIAQGVEMGRPSALQARAQKRHGEVVATWVGGESVMVAEGVIEVEG
jgi:trans-2,3-dihydro-3-hydroxyanthranilate isomerase